MMHEKLYKAKKNWVIGLIAGALLMVGGAVTANADANANTVPSTMLLSQYGYNLQPTVTWSGIDTSRYSGVTSHDPANIDSSVLDANINVHTTGEDTEVNRTTPGFAYNVTANGHSLKNTEDVDVDYYFSKGTGYGTNGVEFDPANGGTISYAPTFRLSANAHYMGASGLINDHRITMRREHDAQMTHNSANNVSYLTKEVTVNGNTVINTIRVKTDNRAVQPGVWGLTIKPFWAVDGDISVHDTAAPYKNGNAFYYVVRDAQGRPQWLEVIRPLKGTKLFSGHNTDGQVGPLGGQQASGNDSTAPYSARNLYMMAPAGTSADFSYTESYYWIGDGYNNPQANINSGYLDGYNLEEVNGRPTLHVSGWHVASTSPDLPNAYLIVFDNTTGREVARQRINHPVTRNDVAAQYRNVANSSRSGFNEQIALPSNVLGHRLTIVARYTDDARNGEGHHTDAWLTNQQISFNMANNACLDSVKVSDGHLTVSGWHATNAALGHPYHYVIIWDASRGCELARQRIQSGQRADVARVYPSVLNASRSGFTAKFNLTNPAYANDQIQVISRYSSDPAGNNDDVDYWFAPQRLLADQGNYGNLDSIKRVGNRVKVAGWHASNQAYGKRYHWIILLDQTSGREVGRQLVNSGTYRPDVANVYQQVINAGKSGYNVTITPSVDVQRHQLQVVSRWTNDPAGNSNGTDYWFAPRQIF